ncbi:MAG: hypothetical protein A3J49_12895 [Gallionellales bacterium RIFCSPHIGHO2_02_FULL_57_16]|nr:MAG: hypothetical protein A3J49_12895 [Gallionellales bacterium RIFCSPHIGHO2_02_FULL_57_16]
MTTEQDKERQPAPVGADVDLRPENDNPKDERAALLFMLEDLERSRHQVEQAHQEWMAALDVVSDPIFLHDREFRILRCNKAYQQCAGIPFKDIIGKPYHEIFPKSGAPLPCCLRAMEKAEEEEEEEEEEEVAAGEAIYRSRAFSIKDEQGAYLYSVHTLEDITASKRAAEVLGESETRFRNLVETSSDWIWEVDGNTVYTYASPKIHDILGYQAAEIIGKTPYDLMPPAEAKRVAELFGRIAAAKKSFTNLENTNLHKDGHRVVLESSGVPVIDPQGKFCGYRGMDRDITARKQAEVLLVESEEKFRKITESAQDAIIMMGADQRISFWNAAAERIFGYTAAEALGQELHHLMAPLAAHAAFTHGFQHFRYSGEGPIIGKVIEINALRKGGEEFPVELSVSATQLHGQWHAIGIVRDISERKLMDEKLQLTYFALDHAVDSVFWMEPSGKFRYVNETACRVLGYSREELLSMGVADIDPNLPEGVPLEMSQATKNAGIGRVESVHRAKDGHLIPVEIMVAYHQYKGEEFHCSFVRDITERKQAEAKLNEQIEELRRWHDATMGREMRVLDLKREVNELLGSSGQPPRYPSAESNDQQKS